MDKKAYFHLPGLFEFYELYKVFLPLFYNHREYFYDWCEIGSIYGAPEECLWGGGRIGQGNQNPYEVLKLMNHYQISPRLTFSNSLIEKKHLSDQRCNELCSLFEKSKEQSGIIIHSNILLKYLKEKYPNLYYVSSTTKVITQFDQLIKEVDNDDFKYVVPDFRLNKSFKHLNSLTSKQKDKIEFLCNECCYYGCLDRKKCYETVSRQNLDDDCLDFKCQAPHSNEGYRFYKAMQNPGFISVDAILNDYLPQGFSQFKIEGRSLGSALVLEMLIYYMVKPEYQIQIREEIYLDNMLDLF